MIRDPQLRQQLKNYLVTANILLLTILLMLLAFEAFVLRPQQILVATSLKQHVVVDINAPKEHKDLIKPDYLGRHLLNKADSRSHGGKHMSEAVDVPVVMDNVKPIAITPKIAIIITNLGLNKRSTELSLTLPSEVALGFLPYTASLKPLLNQAQEDGHEIYIYLPFENNGVADVNGKYTIASSNGEEENLRRLRIILGAQKNYVGVYTNYREVFSSDLEAFTSVLKEIHSRNLGLILGKVDGVDKSIIEKNHIIHSNILLDGEADKESIRKNLERLIELAKRNKKVLGYSQGYVLTINMIKDWLPLLREEGIELVPVSAIMKN